MISSIHAWSTIASAFLASSVEAVEALTVVLAVGVVRGWRSALLGTVAALGLLAALVAAFGLALRSVPIGLLQLVVGTLLLLFGIRWLRKAMLRSAGVIDLHDEEAIYEREVRGLGGSSASLQPRSHAKWDAIAIMTAFKAVTLEGVEVIVIVLALGSVQGLLVAASLGALAACLLVAAVGLALHRPLARVPENSLKFVVGILMTAFGLFWFGEGVGLHWPYADTAILGLMAILVVASRLGVRVARRLGAAVKRVAIPGGWSA
jgi:Ca2+/H+ antiporter, TMEM165/GDT1 family